MAALTLPLPTEAVTEEKGTLARTNTIPRTFDDYKLFMKIWMHASVKTHHNQPRRLRGLENLEWDVKVNLDSLKLTRLLSCGVQSAPMFRRQSLALHCW